MYPKTCETLEFGKPWKCWKFSPPSPDFRHVSEMGVEFSLKSEIHLASCETIQSAPSGRHPRIRSYLRQAILVLVAALALGIRLGDPYSRSQTVDAVLFPQLPRKIQNEPTICVVVRTYWGQGRNSTFGLPRLISSLQRQNHQRCWCPRFAPVFSNAEPES